MRPARSSRGTLTGPLGSLRVRLLSTCRRFSDWRTHLIRVNDYHKTYRETVAVAGLSFEVPAGAILGLVGPNGAGKTTTMRALAGIIRPTRGTLSIAGHDVVADPLAAKRELAYIPDDPKLFDALTVWEHLEFIASAYRVADFAPKGEASCNSLSWSRNATRWHKSCRAGCAQKVAICCAYLHDPRAILFDEPLTGLDPYAIRTLKASIAQRAAAGAAILVSSHLLALVEDLCTHLLILNKGPEPVLRVAGRGPVAVCRSCRARRRWKRCSSGRPNNRASRRESAWHPVVELDRDLHASGPSQTDRALAQVRVPAGVPRSADCQGRVSDPVYHRRARC